MNKYTNEISSLKMFKIAVISKEVSDSIIEKMFPDVFIESEQEISEIIAVLEKHRPTLLQKFDALAKKQIH